MRITKVAFERCVNTGEYNNYRIGAEVEVAEGESGKDALVKLIQFVDNAALTTPKRPTPRD